ncbi:MAG: hypothetical protein ACI4VL_02355 [Bacilli bacterium]
MLAIILLLIILICVILGKNKTKSALINIVCGIAVIFIMGFIVTGCEAIF